MRCTRGSWMRLRNETKVVDKGDDLLFTVLDGDVCVPQEGLGGVVAVIALRDGERGGGLKADWGETEFATVGAGNEGARWLRSGLHDGGGRGAGGVRGARGAGGTRGAGGGVGAGTGARGGGAARGRRGGAGGTTGRAGAGGRVSVWEAICHGGGGRGWKRMGWADGGTMEERDGGTMAVETNGRGGWRWMEEGDGGTMAGEGGSRRVFVELLKG